MMDGRMERESIQLQTKHFPLIDPVCCPSTVVLSQCWNIEDLHSAPVFSSSRDCRHTASHGGRLVSAHLVRVDRSCNARPAAVSRNMGEKCGNGKWITLGLKNWRFGSVRGR